MCFAFLYLHLFSATEHVSCGKALYKYAHFGLCRHNQPVMSNTAIDAAAQSPGADRLVGLVVKASASRAEGPGFESRLPPGFFSGSSHTSDLKIGTPVAPLPGAWRYRVSTGTGRPSVSTL